MLRLLRRSVAIALLLVPTLALAQGEVPTEFDAGDMFFRTHVYFEMASTTAPGCDLFPGEGISAITFRARPSGEPGWGPMLKSRGWNVFQMDHVGCGNTLPPPADDILQLMDKGLYGVYQLGMASNPRLSVAQGFAAAWLLKGRSWDEKVAASGVLIDPWGPQGVQPFADLEPEDLVETREERQDRVWRTLGFGKEYGKLRGGLDLTLEQAKSVADGYEYDQPAYWAGLITGMDSGFDLREPVKLKGWPVLVIRTPAADTAQLAREKAVRAWLDEIGCEVTFVDLKKEDLGDVSGLPWIGSRAEDVLELILDWYGTLGLTDPIPAGR